MRLKKSYRHGGFVLGQDEEKNSFTIIAGFGEFSEKYVYEGSLFAVELNSRLDKILGLQRELGFEDFTEAVELALQEVAKEIGYVEIIHDDKEKKVEAQSGMEAN